MARPDLARPRAGVPAALEALSGRYALVAVVTGRLAAEARRLLGPELTEIEVFGLYGLGTGEGPAPVAAVREEVASIVAGVPGTRIEDKGASVAVHYRGAPDPEAASRDLAAALGPLARDHGLRILPGKMVLELAPADIPGKGRVVARECGARRLRGCLYAGDDLADLEAFAELEELRRRGLTAVGVAVASEESPPGLLEAADVVVEGPAGLVSFLAGSLL